MHLEYIKRNKKKSLFIRLYAGGSRIFEKGVHMYNGAGVHFDDFISFLLYIP